MRRSVHALLFALSIVALSCAVDDMEEPDPELTEAENEVDPCGPCTLIADGQCQTWGTYCPATAPSSGYACCSNESFCADGNTPNARCEPRQPAPPPQPPPCDTMPWLCGCFPPETPCGSRCCPQNFICVQPGVCQYRD
jgi:hypothetical protein